MRRFVFLIWLVFLPKAALAECVVLLHGLARTEASFTVMEQVFLTRGYQVVRPGYPSTAASIKDLAARVVPQAIASCGGQTVHVVTHSLGGILLRAAFDVQRPARLGRVVMLGPPNQGAMLVDRLAEWEVFEFWNGPAGAELGTGENSVPRALPPVDYPVGIIAGNQSVNPVLSGLIDGANDGKVAVVETIVEGMTDHLTLPVTHTFMMNNPVVIAESLHFIETGQFARDITWLDAVTGESVRRGEDEK